MVEEGGKRGRVKGHGTGRGKEGQKEKGDLGWLGEGGREKGEQSNRGREVGKKGDATALDAREEEGRKKGDLG